MLNHGAAPLPQNLPRRTAISGLMPERPDRMRCRVWRVTRSCRAASLTVTSRVGSTSSRRISPGCAGGRCGRLCGFSTTFQYFRDDGIVTPPSARRPFRPPARMYRQEVPQFTLRRRDGPRKAAATRHQGRSHGQETASSLGSRSAARRRRPARGCRGRGRPRAPPRHRARRGPARQHHRAALRRQPAGDDHPGDRHGQGVDRLQQPARPQPGRRGPAREDLGRPRPLRHGQPRIRHLRRPVPLAGRRQREHGVHHHPPHQGAGAGVAGRLLRPALPPRPRGVDGRLLEELHLVGQLLLRRQGGRPASQGEARQERLPRGPDLLVPRPQARPCDRGARRGALELPLYITVENAKDLYAENMERELRSSAGFSSVGWDMAANYCLTNKTHLDEGLRWAQKALDVNTVGQVNFTTLSTLADLQEANNLTAEAKQTRAKALHDPTAGPIDLHQYARQLLAQKHTDEAMEVFKLNAKLHPNAWPVHLGLARRTESRAEATLALPQAPDDANRKNIQGIIEKLEQGKDI